MPRLPHPPSARKYTILWENSTPAGRVLLDELLSEIGARDVTNRTCRRKFRKLVRKAAKARAPSRRLGNDTLKPDDLIEILSRKYASEEQSHWKRSSSRRWERDDGYWRLDLQGEAISFRYYLYHLPKPDPLSNVRQSLWAMEPYLTETFVLRNHSQIPWGPVWAAIQIANRQRTSRNV